MGIPQARWMVYTGKSNERMDDDWGTPISGNAHMFNGKVQMFKSI